MAGHARLSASGAKRWMECPGSQPRVDLLGPDANKESDFSAEGTCAHEGAALALREGQEPWMYIGQNLYTDTNGKAWEFTAEMAEHVALYTDYIRKMYSDGAEMLVEEKIAVEELGDDFGGTADAVVHRLKDGGGFVHVIDLKYGIGVSVPIGDKDDLGNTKFENPQLLYYAYGVLRRLGVTAEDDVKVGGTIVQPRDPHGNTIREAWTTSKAVFEWANTRLLPAMQRVGEEAPPLKPGDWCQFCPAKLLCPVLQGAFGGAANADHAALPDMTDERLALEYELVDPVKKYLRAVEEECYRRAIEGKPVPGTQLEKGRSDRQWKATITLDDGTETDTESYLASVLGEKAYTEPALKSPAQVEREVGGKDLVARAAFKPEARPILKPVRSGSAPVTANFGGGVFAGIAQ